MKGLFKNFAIFWLIGVIMFCAIVFTVRLAMLDKELDPAFYVSLVFVLLAFTGQLAVGYKFFTEDNKEKVFLNLPLLSLSKTCVVVSIILSIPFMVIGGSTPYLAILVSVLVLGLFAFAMIKANTAATAVEQIGEKTAMNTMFLKKLTTASEGLVAKARSDEAKAMTNRVYEALRYSVKSSKPDLYNVESRIYATFTAFSDAVSGGDDAMTKAVGEQLLSLIAERNNMAKTIK